MLCVIALHTHRYHPPKFQPNPNHHDAVVIFAILPVLAAGFRLACCLLAACLLLAKPGRSTLDPKEGYKTKTGSTSSVTLTLTRTLTLTGSIDNKGDALAHDQSSVQPSVSNLRFEPATLETRRTSRPTHNSVSRVQG